ncbi:MAG: rane associated hydrolase [Mucilaginibacter sp.]|nr:rane associated hydrolase [Mucilaginibacter sp.]
MKPQLYLLITLIVFICRPAFSQTRTDIKSLQALKISDDLKIDGVLNEADWAGAQEASGFKLNYPSDTAMASGRTVVKLLYNDHFLYIGAKVFNGKSGQHKYTVSSLKRDFTFTENDAFGVIIDPFHDHTNGVGFYVNALGVQREEQISNGNTADQTYDIEWFDAVRQDSTGYMVEIAIPFRYLRFSKILTDWNINFLRNDITNNQLSSWQPVPRNFFFPNLSFMGRVNWPVPPPQATNNVSLFPSLTYTASQERKERVKNNLKPSLDAKVTVTSSLNLDLTVNPDFSEAEVDQAKVNLTRFDISYPEKRLFFIENSDLFSSFGTSKDGSGTIQPFYSRNIGLNYNRSTGQYQQTSIIGGARLSGKLNKDLRVGLMDIQTAGLNSADAAGNEIKYTGENYSVLALQQKVFSSSSIGFIFTNRQSISNDNTTTTVGDQYNRLAGLEYNLISRNGTWVGKLFNEMMFSPGKTASAQGGFLGANTRRTTSYAGFSRADHGFSPDLGFVPRNNFNNAYTYLNYIFYPKSGFINNIQPVFYGSIYTDSLFNHTDHEYYSGPVINFKNTGSFFIVVLNDYTKLKQPFDPSLTNGKTLVAGTAYSYTSVIMSYISDLRRNLSGNLYLRTGQYYNGSFTIIRGALNYKLQPYGTVGFNYNLTFIRLPPPYSNNNIIAIGPQTSISFSKQLFLSSNVQYTSLNTNINYFFRLQWRFRPLSDLYVVYSNNENTALKVRQNQSLIIKFVYFL